jgi:hypothetical protein
MGRFILLFFLFALIYSCKEENKINQFNDLRQITWLTGRWKMEGKQIIESWNRTSDSSISGMAISQESGDTKVLEVLKIFDENGKFYYSATVNDQEEQGTIRFPLVFYNEDKLVFENTAHDFPKEIEYSIDDTKKILTVHLRGNDNGKTFKFIKAD